MCGVAQKRSCICILVLSFGLTVDSVAVSEVKALYQTMATVKAVQVRQYPSTRLLVKSSVVPIALGREISPFTESHALHDFICAH